MRAWCAIAVIFVLRAAWAQVPGMMNYQGYLTDAGGAPISGSYDMTFRIHNAHTGGALLWEEAHAGVPVSDGLFSVILGETSALDASVFAGEAWLELEVDAELMTPRVRVVSVGYSMVAAVAHSVAADSVGSAAIKDGEIANADVSGTAAIDVSKLNGVLPLSGGTMTGALELAGDPTSNLEAATMQYVDGAISTAGDAYVKKAGDTMTGTLNLPANGLVAGTSQLVLSGGKVGIGTAAPGAALDVVGDVNVSGNITLSEKTRYLTISYTAFTPSNSATTYGTNEANGLWATNPGGGGVQAPLMLPHGAVVTEVRAKVYDNEPAGSSKVSIHRRTFDASHIYDKLVETPVSSDQANWQILTDSTIGVPAIDNENYVYTIIAMLGTSSPDLRLYAVRVTYTATVPLP